MKKIYRSKSDKIFGGVCGGISEYFDIDSSLVRIVAILLLLINGFGLLAYVLAWIIIPVAQIKPFVEKDDIIEAEEVKKAE